MLRRFPEQLAFVKVWQPKRIVWNTSPFFFQTRQQPFDPTGLTTLEAGGFNSLLGRSYTEIAAASLSMHKSQGVGSPPRRGERKEYFKLLRGAPIEPARFLMALIRHGAGSRIPTRLPNKFDN